MYQNKQFLGDLSQPLITGELLDKKKEYAKSNGGRDSLTLRSVPTLDLARKKNEKKIEKIGEAQEFFNDPKLQLTLQ